MNETKLHIRITVEILTLYLTLDYTREQSEQCVVWKLSDYTPGYILGAPNIFVD